MSRLGDTLPPYVSSVNGIWQLLDAMGDETEALDAAARSVSMQFSAANSDTDIFMWEKEFGLLPRPDLPDEDRRAFVLGAFSLFNPCTKETAMSLFSTLCGGGTVTYEENPALYSIAMHAQTLGRIVPNLPGICHIISRRIPAHVECRLSAEGSMDSAAIYALANYGVLDLEIFATEPTERTIT